MALLPVGVLSAALMLTFVCTRDVVGVDWEVCGPRLRNCNEGHTNPFESFDSFCQYATALDCQIEVFSSEECEDTGMANHVTAWKEFSESVCGEDAALFEANWHCFNDEMFEKWWVCFRAFRQTCSNLDDYRTCLSSIFDSTCAAEFVSQVIEFQVHLVELYAAGGHCAADNDIISESRRMLQPFF
jgi:hypothetical protein